LFLNYNPFFVFFPHVYGLVGKQGGPPGWVAEKTPKKLGLIRGISHYNWLIIIQLVDI
jgi:hypothetical protein